jgi:tRNA-modifying protein YgfZ
MNVQNLAPLAERSIVRVSGEDAKKLLQGLVSNDMELLESEPAMHAALLSPQGKILFEFFVVKAGVDFLLETAAAQASSLLKRLQLYKLRAKVEIADAAADYRVFGLWGELSIDACRGPGRIAFVDPRLAQLGARIIAEAKVASELAAAAGRPSATAQDWHAHRIGLGVPEAVRDYPLGDTFLHEANFDKLAGVSFSKGCFVGQEVASRMQHRGGGRKRVVPVEGTAALTPGSAVMAGTVGLGSVGSVQSNRGLALIRLDRAAEALAAGTVLTAGAIPITLIKPVWGSLELAPARQREPK